MQPALLLAKYVVLCLRSSFQQMFCGLTAVVLLSIAPVFQLRSEKVKKYLTQLYLQRSLGAAEVGQFSVARRLSRLVDSIRPILRITRMSTWHGACSVLATEQAFFRMQDPGILVRLL
jgi:hypothetical protein